MAGENNNQQKQKIDYGGQKHKWANELNRFVLQTKRDFINYFDCLKIAVKGLTFMTLSQKECSCI